MLGVILWRDNRWLVGLGSHASLADSLANGSLPPRSSNFSALQQHIDDLTKEKFELVRGLQVSRIIMHVRLHMVQVALRLETCLHEGCSVL